MRQSLDPLMIYSPAFFSQHRRDLPKSVAPIITGQVHHPADQARLIAGNMILSALSAAGLIQHTASPKFRYALASEAIAHMLDCNASLGRAQKFPMRLPMRIAFSSSASARSRSSQALSLSSSFRLFPDPFAGHRTHSASESEVCADRPICLAASCCIIPCDIRSSASRSFGMISSRLYFFPRDIFFSLQLGSTDDYFQSSGGLI